MTKNAITGGNDYLIYQLNKSMECATNIRIIVAFLMESGAKIIGRQLKEAAGKGVSIKILTGTYRCVTEPSAIYYLLNILGPNVDIRFFDDSTKSFHPKAYLFDYEDDSVVYVGSSNMSASGLTSGIEWNYKLSKGNYPKDYQVFSDTFDDLFYNHSEAITEKSLREYTQSWKKPDYLVAEEPVLVYDVNKPEPFGIQVEALYELNSAREEGIDKGLVIAATGVGKTYLSAFDSKGFERILFVAHREEILNQGAKTFESVRPNSNIGYFYGEEKDVDCDVCFATVQTLSKENYLKDFPPHYFNYIIIDEFHHAAADSYRRLLKHFEPDFLLGLTATPYRTDNRDIYSLCDDNVIYEVYLKDAINRDLLVPFKYFGIYDATDYSQIQVQSGQYVVTQLERELSQKERADLILKEYRKLAGKQTIGFCASINEPTIFLFYWQEKIQWERIAG